MGDFVPYTAQNELSGRNLAKIPLNGPKPLTDTFLRSILAAFAPRQAHLVLLSTDYVKEVNGESRPGLSSRWMSGRITGRYMCPTGRSLVVPNIKSAIKRVKTAERNRLRNRAYKSQIRTVQSRLEDTLKSANVQEIDTQLSSLYVAIDKAVAKGVLHKNTAARKKSRLARKAFATKSAGK